MLQARQPRVQITYVATDHEEKELPFVVGVMGDFCGDPWTPPLPLAQRPFVEIDHITFDDVMKRMAVGLRLRVTNALLADDSDVRVALRFTAMADFAPAAVVRQVEPLRRLRRTRDKLRHLVGELARASPGPSNDDGDGQHRAEQVDDSPVPVRDLAVACALHQFKRLADPLDTFLIEDDLQRALRQWFGNDDPLLAAPSCDVLAIINALDRDIARIDDLLSAQVNAIIHHPRFQRLEASWRGLHFLVEQADREEGVIFKVIHWPWPEVCRDLERALEFDQSQLFDKIYSAEFGMPGGRPYGVLVGDYAVQHRPSRGHRTTDVDALRGIAQVSAAAFAPFVVGCTPLLLGLESFAQLGPRLDLRTLLLEPEYARWRSLQELADSRFLAVALPRVLMRLPYLDDGSRDDGFRFRETVEASDAGRYLWGNAAYAFAAVLVREFVTHGWFADIRGVRQMPTGTPGEYNGGLVAGLPVQSHATDRSGVAIKVSVEAALSEYMERELAELGFLPISDCKNTPWSAFRSAQSLQRPARYTSEIATTNARLSAMSSHVFCASRFAHYIKVIMRDRIGGFANAEECESYLMKWLMNYYSANIDASLAEKARFPLQEASVRVRELPGQPGAFACTMRLCPHFQPTDVISSFRLVTELAAGAST